MSNFHYVDLCLVRTDDGSVHLVKTPSYRVGTGDLIAFQPIPSQTVIGTVDEHTTLDENSEAYRLISHAAPIFEALRIFSLNWELEGEEE